MSKKGKSIKIDKSQKIIKLTSFFKSKYKYKKDAFLDKNALINLIIIWEIRHNPHMGFSYHVEIYFCMFKDIFSELDYFQGMPF